jgi:hypothetical protein
MQEAKAGSREHEEPCCWSKGARPLLVKAGKKEESFAKEIGDVRGLWRSETVPFFHLFFAASSGASNCDLRIGAAGRGDVWDWIGSLKGELFSTGKPRALMI